MFQRTIFVQRKQHEKRKMLLLVACLVASVNTFPNPFLGRVATFQSSAASGVVDALKDSLGEDQVWKAKRSLAEEEETSPFLLVHTLSKGAERDSFFLLVCERRKPDWTKDEEGFVSISGRGGPTVNCLLFSAEWKRPVSVDTIFTLSAVRAWYYLEFGEDLVAGEAMKEEERLLWLLSDSYL